MSASASALAVDPPVPSLLPVDVLPHAIAESIREHAASADRDRRLPAVLVEELRAAGAFALTTPRALGGHEATIEDLMRVYEALGAIDGATAWNIWNGATGFVAAMLDDDAVAEMWVGGVEPIIANSAYPSGAAIAEGEDFLLSGRWAIVSAV